MIFIDFTVPVIDNFGDMGFALSLALDMLVKYPEIHIRFWSENAELFEKLLGRKHEILVNWYEKNRILERLEYCELDAYSLSNTPQSPWRYNFFGYKIPLDGIP